MKEVTNQPGTAEQRHDDHVVRPRWVWAGVAAALAGTALAGFGVASWSLTPVVVGVVVSATGAVVALRGGILYDTHGVRPVRAELTELRRGAVHPGTAPGDMVTEPQVRRGAIASSMTAARAVAASEAATRPGLLRAGGMLLLAGAGLVLGAQGLYAHTHVGQHHATRDLGLAVLAAFSGLRFLVGVRPGRAWSLLAAGSGAALVAGAVLGRHDSSAGTLVEATAGACVLLAALLSLDRKRQSAHTHSTGRHL